jgi:hypothetical protein
VTPLYEAFASQLAKIDENITEILRRCNMAFELARTHYEQAEIVRQPGFGRLQTRKRRVRLFGPTAGASLRD